MKEYETYLFDWDGCLAKTLDVWLESYIQTFKEYGLTPSISEITHTVFGDWNGPSRLGIKDIDAFTISLMKKVNARYAHAPLSLEAKSVLHILKKRGKTLALLSSTKRESLERALQFHNLDQLFDLVLTAEDVIKHKPDPEIIITAITKLKADYKTTVIVGDSKSDLGAGIGAGIDTVLYYPKHNEVFYDHETLIAYKPTYIIDSLESITAFD